MFLYHCRCGSESRVTPKLSTCLDLPVDEVSWFKMMDVAFKWFQADDRTLCLKVCTATRCFIDGIKHIKYNVIIGKYIMACRKMTEAFQLWEWNSPDRVSRVTNLCDIRYKSSVELLSIRAPLPWSHSGLRKETKMKIYSTELGHIFQIQWESVQSSDYSIFFHLY